VSQDRVIATLFTEELFLSTQYIKLSQHIRKVIHGEWDTDGNATQTAVPAGLHTSKLDLTTGYKVSDKNRLFCTIIL
jgi:hypothetical protein